MESKFFNDPAKALEVFVETFKRAAQNEEILESIHSMNDLINFDLSKSDPSILFYLDTRDGQRVAAAGHLDDVRADVTLALTADTAHKAFSNKLNPVMAVATGKMKARGNQVTLLRLAPLLALITPIYNQVLIDCGLEEIKL